MDYNIFVPEGMEAPPKSIIQSPELQLYIADFGKRKDDKGLVAKDASSLEKKWLW